MVRIWISFITNDERVQWTPGLHVHTVFIARPVGDTGAYIDPSQPRSRRLVHQSNSTQRCAVSHLRGTVRVRVESNGPTGIRTQGILLAKEALYH